MPLISTKGKYGLAAICELKKRQDESADESPMQIKEIAVQASIPQNYLEQLLTKLRKAGFVKSIRGAKGGYILAMPPEEIKVLDLLLALEDDLKIVDTQTEYPILNLLFDDAKENVKNIFNINLVKLSQYQKHFLNYNI